jgi:hypothetical protein
MICESLDRFSFLRGLRLQQLVSHFAIEREAAALLSDRHQCFLKFVALLTSHSCTSSQGAPILWA